MFEQVTTSILSFASFSEEQVAVILSRLKAVTLKKDELPHKRRTALPGLLFYQPGQLPSLYHTGQRRRSHPQPVCQTEWVFEYKSFMSQQPSENIIRAASDSEVFCLSAFDFHELVKISDIFFRLGRILELAIQNQDFQHNRLSPEQKYERLLSTRPELLQHFPLKHIASYMGMTPETLSRIRKKISS